MLNYQRVPYSRVVRKMSSRVCTWPISLRRPGRLWRERGLLTCYEPWNWPEGSRKTRASYTNYHIFNAKCSVMLCQCGCSGEISGNWWHGTGWHWKLRKIGWMELTPQMSLLVLMICSTIGLYWFCAIPRFVLGSCSMTALQVGEVGPDVPVQKYSKDSRSI